MKLALGTAQFGLSYGITNETGQVTPSVAASILSLARLNGINLIDTAIAYGDSEACLGNLDTEGMHIVTKLPKLPTTCGDIFLWVKEQVQDSLNRLKRKFLYGILLHQTTDLASPSGPLLVRALQSIKDDGLVKKIGVSIYSPTDLEDIRNIFQPDLIQAPLNLVDRRFVTSGWLDKMYYEGVEVHVRSVFLQGILLQPPEKIPSKFYRWHKLWDRWHSWQSEYGISAMDACLAYPLSFKQVNRVIVGVDSLMQLDQAITALSRLPTLPLDTLPDLSCYDESLINPFNWTFLKVDK